MFPKQTIVGILISKAVFEIQFSRKETSRIGYIVLPSISVRAEKRFLDDLKRSLAQHQVKSNIREIESVQRQKPILKISGIKNTHKAITLIPEYYSDANNSLNTYKEIILKLVNKEHLTLEGLELIMKMRGILNGTNDD